MCREQEQDANRYDEDDAWRIQDPRVLLDGSREHGLPRHQQVGRDAARAIQEPAPLPPKAKEL